MNPSSPADARNRGRFWLALSLSSVTALAVTVPLAFRAADAGQQDDPATGEVTTPLADIVEPEPTEDSIVTDSGVTSTTLSPLIIDKRQSVDADLVIRSGTLTPARPAPTTTTVVQTISTESLPESTTVPEGSTTSTTAAAADQSGSDSGADGG